MIALVDYLTFSVSGISTVQSFADELFGRIEWQSGKGMYGYLHCMYYDGIRVFSKQVTEGYDICVSMSGFGCRAFETIRGESFAWEIFFEDLIDEYPSLNFSRIDVALDVREEWCPSMKSICGYVAKDKYVSRFTRNIYTLGSEEFVFFGSPSSDTRLRVYNKALERGYPDDHWIRFEYQLRNKSASKFIKEYLRTRNIGFTVRSCLNNSIRFTTKPNKHDHHQDRLNTAFWWKKVVDGADRISLFEPVGCDYNLSRLERYLVTQVAPSLFTYLRCKGGDLTELLESGKLRLNDRQLNLINELVGALDV